jgi:hypothetical protein
VAGLVLFLATLVFVVLYALVALLQRNWDLVAEIAGVPSIAEVMKEETHGIDVVMATADAPRSEK